MDFFLSILRYWKFGDFFQEIKKISRIYYRKNIFFQLKKMVETQPSKQKGILVMKKLWGIGIWEVLDNFPYDRP
jgi:hypothetical protein